MMAHTPDDTARLTTIDTLLALADLWAPDDTSPLGAILDVIAGSVAEGDEDALAGVLAPYAMRLAARVTRN